jgi:casein kinase 1
MDFITLPDTEVLEKIGEGSYGTILRVKNTKLGIEQAVKVTTSTGANLVLEATILKAVRGAKGFPKLYRYAKQAVEQCIVMELLGDSLETLMKPGTLVHTPKLLSIFQ